MSIYSLLSSDTAPEATPELASWQYLSQLVLDKSLVVTNIAEQGGALSDFFTSLGLHCDYQQSDSAHKWQLLNDPPLQTVYEVHQLLLDMNPAIDVTAVRTIDSTNSWLKKHAPAHILARHNNATAPAQSNTLVCIADHQSMGRGRSSGKQWHSPFAKNIYLSIALLTQRPLTHFSQLSMGVGAVCAELLAELGLKPQLKWPNDIWLDNQKVGGILTESVTAARPSSSEADTLNGQHLLVVGIGLNCFMLDPEDASSKQKNSTIDQPWTDVQTYYGQHHQGQRLDKTMLHAQLTDRLVSLMETWNEESWTVLLPKWQTYDALKGQEITLHSLSGAQPIQCKAQGITSDGNLMAEMPDGTIEKVSSGEVSVKLQTKE